MDTQVAAPQQTTAAVSAGSADALVPAPMMGIRQVGPNGEESATQLISAADLGSFLLSASMNRSDEEENGNSEEDGEQPEIKLEDTKDADNYYEPPKRSPTKDMTADQLLDGICTYIENVMAKTAPMDGSAMTFGANTQYVDDHVQGRMVTVSNIVFEVNQVTVKSVRVIRHRGANGGYTASVAYSTQPDHYWNGPSYFLKVSNPVMRDAISGLYKNLKALKHCSSCKTVYDSSLSEHCVICLFSDYFTRENPEIKCVICTERTRDFTTLQNCGHRYCWPCLQKVSNRKCPMCRTSFNL